jgi:hypothetical protein
VNQFGRTLFSGSRFIFWSLAPFLVLFAVVMPLSITEWNVTRVILITVMDAAALLLVIGLYNTKRFWWALRGVTMIVFFGYLAMLIDELIHGDTTVKGLLRGESPLEVIKTFIGVAIPCLLYTLLGRFSRREVTRNRNITRSTRTLQRQSTHGRVRHERKRL